MIEIIYFNNYEKAKEFKDSNRIEGTVEAEYGDYYIEGELITLAHHVEKFRDNPAPCQVVVSEAIKEKINKVLISHIDLDTIGGCLELIDKKPSNDEFWKTAAFIDINGPHRQNELTEEMRDYLNGWYAFKQDNQNLFVVEEGSNVYPQMLMFGEALERILGGDQDLITKGKAYVKNQRDAENKRLIEETPFYRVFVTHDYFTAASYYSEKLDSVARCTITYNTNFNSITLAFSDSEYNAREIVQALWGKEAGGHDQIAGSPRGQEMTMFDFNEIIGYIQQLEIESNR